MRAKPTDGAKAQIKKRLLRPARFVNSEFLYMNRVNMACARGALNTATRRLDPLDTSTWEFSAFSQNGEDGLIEQLLLRVRAANRYFLEIGAADGLENNSSYLALVKKYSGVMVEADEERSARAEAFLKPLNWGVRYVNMLVTPESVPALKRECVVSDPDLFSLDIDGNDYYVADSVMRCGLKPKVVCVEYNSAFGQHRSLTVQYDPAVSYRDAHSSHLYYGVSLAGWKRFWAGWNYRFVTVDSNGVNALFVDPEAVDVGSLEGVRNIEFRENFAQRERYRLSPDEQFELVRDMPFRAIA
jgi:hypothetical protein